MACHTVIDEILNREKPITVREFFGDIKFYVVDGSQITPGFASIIACKEPPILYLSSKLAQDFKYCMEKGRCLVWALDLPVDIALNVSVASLSENMKTVITMRDSIEAEQGKCQQYQGGVKTIYFISASDLNSDNPFEVNENNEITKINLKRKGTYRGKKYERKFNKMPDHEQKAT